MFQRISITTSVGKIEAELHDTPTARTIAEALPLEARASTWGEEIYFEIPVQSGLDDTAREVVAAGDLGYWPRGRALCLFFGPTPISGPGEIRPASAVNIVGRLAGNLDNLRNIADGTIIKITIADPD